MNWLPPACGAAEGLSRFAGSTPNFGRGHGGAGGCKVSAVSSSKACSSVLRFIAEQAMGFTDSAGTCRDALQNPAGGSLGKDYAGRGPPHPGTFRSVPGGAFQHLRTRAVRIPASRNLGMAFVTDQSLKWVPWLTSIPPASGHEAGSTSSLAGLSSTPGHTVRRLRNCAIVPTSFAGRNYETAGLKQTGSLAFPGRRAAEYSGRHGI